jgi:hypothetical protein
MVFYHDTSVGFILPGRQSQGKEHRGKGQTGEKNITQ